MLDDDGDGWPDLFVANDTQPNKLYRNLRNGTFRDVALEAGVALSDDGKARAGMGVDAADFDNSGRMGLAITNFDNEMLALYRGQATGTFQDTARRAGVGVAVAEPARVRLRCLPTSISTARSTSWWPTGTSTRPCAASRATSATRRRRSCFSTRVAARSATPRRSSARRSRSRASAAGWPCGDFDRDGDVDLLMTTNNGPAVLFRTDEPAGNTQPAADAAGHQVEPRRDRRPGAGLPRRHVADRAWCTADPATCRSRSCR